MDPQIPSYDKIKSIEPEHKRTNIKSKILDEF